MRRHRPCEALQARESAVSHRRTPRLVPLTRERSTAERRVRMSFSGHDHSPHGTMQPGATLSVDDRVRRATARYPRILRELCRFRRASGVPESQTRRSPGATYGMPLLDVVQSVACQATDNAACRGCCPRHAPGETAMYARRGVQLSGSATGFSRSSSDVAGTPPRRDQ